MNKIELLDGHPDALRLTSVSPKQSLHFLNLNPTAYQQMTLSLPVTPVTGATATTERDKALIDEQLKNLKKLTTLPSPHHQRALRSKMLIR